VGRRTDGRKIIKKKIFEKNKLNNIMILKDTTLN
jgi:hypothetical protein